MAREGKLFSNTLLLGVSAAVGKALSLFLLPFFTAALTPAEFGVCEILVSTALLLTPLFSMYAPQATFRFFAQGERGAVRVGALMLGVGVTLFTLLSPLLGRIAVLQPYRVILYVFVLASLARSFASHILRARGEFLLFAIQQLFCSVLTALLQLFFLYSLHLGIKGYLWGIVLGDAITFVILLIPLLGGITWERGTPRGLCVRMLRFALPLVPAALLWWGMSAAERYILLYFCGERATGLYAAAARFPALIGFATSVFLEAWHYASLQGDEESRGVRFGHTYALFLPVLIALGGICVAFSPLFVSVFLSDAYADAVQLLGFLIFGAVCAGMASFLDSIYSLQLRSAASLYTSALATLVHTGLSFLLVPLLGAVGAAVAGALGFLFLFLLRAAHTARLLHFPRYTKALVPALCLLFVAGVLFAANQPFFGTVVALFSILPLKTPLASSAIFLIKRLRIFLLRGPRKRTEQ